MTDNLIEVVKLRKEFGGLVATNDVDFTIPRGSIVSLIGPNGAGKTTFFNMLTGVYKPTSGSIIFDGRRRHRQAAARDHGARHRPHVPEHPPVRQMTALENVLVGMHCRLKAASSARSSARRRCGARRRPRARRRASCSSTAACRERHEEQAGSLPYGDQRRLEVARALATDPKLLLLDEPTAGMNPQEIGGVHRLRPPRARRAGAHGAADRARHEGRDGRLRALHRARLRREDRRGDAGRDPGERARDRGLPRQGGDRHEHRAANGYVLELDDIHTYYGDIHALKGVSLNVDAGEIVTLIGANGAGKSTTLRSITASTTRGRARSASRARTSRTRRRTRSSRTGSPSAPRAGGCSRACR